MRVNLYGALACIRAAAPAMIAKRSGAIVNIGSFTGKRPAANRLVYATSKMALVGLTRTLAPHQVRCNVVSPGPVEGERVQEVIARASAAQRLTETEVRQSFLSWSPMGGRSPARTRFATPSSSWRPAAGATSPGRT
ncbi:MAG TPA: SDR family oxidoreductase [Sphingobium sp.]|nr:SDR family oxidoreductase [Sphingobium sp.]